MIKKNRIWVVMWKGKPCMKLNNAKGTMTTITNVFANRRSARYFKTKVAKDMNATGLLIIEKVEF